MTDRMPEWGAFIHCNLNSLCCEPLVFGEKNLSRDLPGHIKNAFRSIDRFLPLIDIIIELLDARMPESSRIANLAERLGKKSIVVLGKADLADPGVSREWVDYYERQGTPCVLLDIRSSKSVKKLRSVVRTIFKNKSRPGESSRSICRIMVLGIPNVGKSSLINALSGRRAAKTADMPGVTRNIQWIKLDDGLELLDLPGILDYALLTRGELLRLINTIPGKDEDPFSGASLLYEILASDAHAGYVPGISSGNSEFGIFLSEYAVRMNFFSRGNQPDLQRSARDLIRKFQRGDFGPITLERPGTLSKKACPQ